MDYEVRKLFFAVLHQNLHIFKFTIQNAIMFAFIFKDILYFLSVKQSTNLQIAP